MYRQKLFFAFIFLILTVVTAEDNKKKTCIHNLLINGTNLVALYRKQLLIVGITNLNNPASRAQANRYNDLYRELERENIRDSTVRLILINELDGISALPGRYFGKVRIFQDNAKDRLVKKLRNQRQSSNNFLFGRCGYLIFAQEHPNTNLEDARNYQDLIRNVKTALRQKRRCERLCS